MYYYNMNIYNMNNLKTIVTNRPHGLKNDKYKCENDAHLISNWKWSELYKAVKGCHPHTMDMTSEINLSQSSLNKDQISLLFPCTTRKRSAVM